MSALIFTQRSRMLTPVLSGPVRQQVSLYQLGMQICQLVDDQAAGLRKLADTLEELRKDSK